MAWVASCIIQNHGHISGGTLQHLTCTSRLMRNPQSFGSSAVVGACVGVPLGEAVLPGAMISGGQTSRARTHIKHLCPDGEVSAFPVPGVLVSRRHHGPHGTALGTSAHTPPGGFSYVAFITLRYFLSMA